MTTCWTDGGACARSPARSITRFRVRATLSLPCTRHIRRRMSRASSFPRADTKREENSKRHQVRRPYNPIWKDERLADGVKEERRVHRMTDMPVDPLRYESMVLAQFKGTDQYVPRSECDRWNNQRPPTRHKTPAPNGQGRSEYSANEKIGDTTQINGARNPIHASLSRATSRGPFQLRATLTPRLRRP